MSVGRSDVAGRGMFADRTFTEDDCVIEYDNDVRCVADLGLLNHSCDPNLGWINQRTLLARRDITTGEELTVDYATCIADPAFTLWCHCGTYRCRQVVEGTDWRIPQLRQRYAGHWAPNVQTLLDG